MAPLAVSVGSKVTPSSGLPLPRLLSLWLG